MLCGLSGLWGQVTVSETDFFLGIFLLLPPVLLFLRFLWQKPWWWLIVLLVAVVGWAAWLMTAVSHFEHLQDLVSQSENPDPALVAEAYSDGGPLTFAALFGWLISLIYGAIWLVVYLLATGIRNAIRRTKNGPRPKP